MTKGRKFAAFDIDGTLIRWQLYHAIADALTKLGYIPTEAFKPIREARLAWKKRQHTEAFGEYEAHLVRFYDAILKNLEIKHFNEAADLVFEEYKDQVYTYTRDLIAKLKNDGYILLAISGSQTEVVSKIVQYYGFDDCIGTEYLHENDRFSGQSIYHAGDKKKALLDLVTKHGCSLKDSLAVGDSASDIKMLEVVERPIAFNPERRLFERAKQAGWSIVIERKNMVYELEGRDGKYELAKTN